MSPICPCCADRLIHHIRQGSPYWWCHSCWAEMPNMEEVCGLSAHKKAGEDRALVPVPQPLLFPTLQEKITPAKHPISINRPFAHRVA